MNCPYHTDPTPIERSRCPLHQLADHTITMTEARMPGVAAIVVLVDARDRTHTALGSDVEPTVAADLLEYHAQRLRRAAAAGAL